MGTLADEMHPSIAMDLARVELVIGDVIAFVEKHGAHPILDPEHIVIGEGLRDGELSRAAPYAAPETIRSGELHWRAIVSTRTRVRCWSSECPKLWSELTPTKHDNIRVCPKTSHAVHYCASVAQASALEQRRDMFAIDVSLADEAVRDAPFDIPPPNMNPPAPGFRR